MREILFRGKRVDNGEWFNGFYGKSGENAYIIYDNDIAVAYVSMKEVIPETVGQYTGLTDKNGKKIFEGDIVTSEYYLKKDKTKNSVIEYGEWNCDCCNGVYGFVSNGLVDFGNDDVVVIGNIYDNPELLGGE